MKIETRDRMLILIIACAGVICRIGYIADYIKTEVFPIFELSDAHSYYLWARNIASGDVWGRAAFLKWPFYAYLLASWIKLFGNNIPLFYIFQFFSGILNCILVYLIARELFNRTAAFVAAMLCVFYGLFIFFESLLIYTTISLLLNSVLFLYFLYLQKNATNRNLFWGGLLVGIATGFQGNSMVFGIPAAAWVLYNSGLKRGKAVKGSLAFAAGFIIIAGGITLRNYLVEKDFVPIAGNTGINFYLGNNPEADGLYSSNIFSPRQEAMFVESKIMAKAALGKKEIKTSEVSAFWFHKAFDFIRSNPRAYAGLLVKRLAFLFSPREFVHDHEYRFIAGKIRIFKVMLPDLRFILPLVFLGIVLALKIFRRAALLYILLGAFSLSIMAFFVASRYRIVMVPFLFIFAGYAVFCVWEAVKGRAAFRLAAYFAFLIAFFILSNIPLFTKGKATYMRKTPKDFVSHFSQAVAYENAGEYGRAIGELHAADRMSPNNPHIIFAYGSVFFHSGNVIAAEDKFKEAIKLNPLYVDAYYNLGLIYNRQARFTEAKNVLEKGVSLDPDDASLHFELAKAYKASGNVGEAKKELESSLRVIDRWRADDIAVIKNELESLERAHVTTAYPGSCIVSPPRGVPS
jgi:tetratricopeptide (TPR) repeat protein